MLQDQHEASWLPTARRGGASVGLIAVVLVEGGVERERGGLELVAGVDLHGQA